MRLLELTDDFSGISPVLVVTGSYLPNFGFDVDTKVIVEVTKGQILIKPLELEK